MPALKKTILWGVLACALILGGQYVYKQAVKADARILHLEEQNTQHALVMEQVKKDQLAQQAALEKWLTAKQSLDALRRQRTKQLKEAAIHEDFTQWSLGALPDGAVRVFGPLPSAD